MARAFSAMLLVVAGCRSADVPDQRDMSALVEAYEAPTAALDRELAERVALSLASGRDAVETLRSLSVRRVVGRVKDEIEPDKEPDAGVPEEAFELHGVRLRGSGNISITYRCPGFASPLDSDRGALRVLLTVRRTRIESVGRVRLESCRTEIPSPEGSQQRVAVDGIVDLHLGGPLRVGDSLASRNLTFDFHGDVTVRGTETPVRVDFQLAASGAEAVVRVIGPDDEHVLYEIASSGSVHSVWATNGRWSCNFEERLCVRERDPDSELRF